MAIDYDSLFEDLGEIVELTNKIANNGTSVLTGTAQTGASSTITLASSGTSTVNDTYKRFSIKITGGTGVGQIRTISSYNGSTKVATVDTTWAVNPDNTSTYNIQKDWIKELEKRFDAISGEYTDSGKDDLLDGVNSLINGFKIECVTQANAIAGLATIRLQHKKSILDEMPQLAGSTDISKILEELIRNMKDNSKTIQRSVLSLGTVTEDKAKSSAGTLFVSKELDGETIPISGSKGNPEYSGVDSELAYPETFTVECITDSEVSSALEGLETFSITGEKSRSIPWDWETDGSGSGASVNPINNTGIIANNDFETFSSNVPSSWTLDSGTAGTHVLEEDTAADVHHGTRALQLTGNASEANIQISQDITGLTPLTRYLFTCYIKGQSGTSAGTLTIQLEDGSGTQVGSTNISMNAAALAAQTSYGIESFYITIPAEIPDNIELVIKWTGTPSAHSVRIDWLGFGKVTYHGGVGFCVVSDTEKFLKRDRFQVTTDYTSTGVFQDFFREFFKVQLPSAASPNISDSLASD